MVTIPASTTRAITAERKTWVGRRCAMAMPIWLKTSPATMQAASIGRIAGTSTFVPAHSSDRETMLVMTK